MQITVFGASGKVGRLVVQLALQRGYSVVAVVHRHNPFVTSDTLRVVQGDISDAAIVTQAMEGSEAVICTLGSWGSKRRDIVSAGMRAIIPAMQAQAMARIITLTGSGAVAPDQKAGIIYRLMMKVLAPFPVGKIFADGEQHMRLLATSKLDWTTIRSPIMSSQGTAEYQLSLRVGSPLATIPRAAVAKSIVDQLGAADFSKQAPVIHRT